MSQNAHETKKTHKNKNMLDKKKKKHVFLWLRCHLDHARLHTFIWPTLNTATLNTTLHAHSEWFTFAEPEHKLRSWWSLFIYLNLSAHWTPCKKVNGYCQWGRIHCEQLELCAILLWSAMHSCLKSDPLIKLNCHSDVIMVASLCHLVSLSASWQSLAFHKAQSMTFLTSGFRYSRMASTRRAKLQQWKLKHTMQNSCKGDVGYINKWSWARRRRCLMPFPFKVLHSAVLCWLCFPLYQ